MTRFLTIIAALFAFAIATPAMAQVQMHFHSFNGSVFFGRYPHAFVVLEGKLADGTRVNENYGFTAADPSPAVLRGPVKHKVMAEPPKYVQSTNRHFSVTLSDEQVAKVRATMRKWRDAPGDAYDLDTRSCIHFVGEMARIAGLDVVYPKKMLRRPKKWLNHLTRLNPELGAAPIK